MNYPKATFRDEYSWISHALSQGYSTLAIDRLGNGNSSRPDPLNVVQGPLQLSVMREVIRLLREGGASYIPKKFNKIIMATHSYGSILGRLMSTVFPQSGADAYILTATSSYLHGLQAFIQAIKARSASAVDPRFPNLAPGYLAATPSTIRSVIYGLEGTFDPEIASWDAESPHIFAIGEIAGRNPNTTSSFEGPVLVLTGRQDQIVCGNGTIEAGIPDCYSSDGDPRRERELFPKASRFGVYIPENSAHNLNTHYSAPETFGVAHEWLQSVGF